MTVQTREKEKKTNKKIKRLFFKKHSLYFLVEKFF